MRNLKILVADRSQVLAFRLGSHNLASRLPLGSFIEAAGACGIQNTPPGSASLAFHARVKDLKPADISRALEVDKRLLQMWSLRGSPHVFPTSDAALFTLGLLPEDDESRCFFISGAKPALDLLGLSATDAIEHTEAELYDALDGREMTLTQLGIELAQRVSQHLTPQQLVSWQSPSFYAANQLLGEAIVHFALHVLALQGLFCFASRRGNQALFTLTGQWLGASLPGISHEDASAGLVRRYLRCYGPSTADHFAEWAGIAPAQAHRAWILVQPDLIQINFDGRSTWIHQQDLSHFRSPSMPEGIRFIPPHDPFLQLRDRVTLIPEKTYHRYIWKRAGNPGVVLAEGQPIALWRSNKKGQRLNLAIELLETTTQRDLSTIEAEAATLAPYKHCTTVGVEFHQLTRS